MRAPSKELSIDEVVARIDSGVAHLVSQGTLVGLQLWTPDGRLLYSDLATADPLTDAVEEGLRMHPAFSFMARAATKDVELHGQQIKEGDRVLLWYLASNRDASVFENPHTFDLDRPNREDHQAFGGFALEVAGHRF